MGKRMHLLLTVCGLMATLLPFVVTADEPKSADAVARELSNPTTALASLDNSLEYSTFTGNLPGADDQSGWLYSFQPSLPFPQANGKNIIFRPLFTVFIDQPYFDPASGRFDSKEFELGDVAFDLAYGGTDEDTGILSLYGLFGSLPTATDDAVGSDQYQFGPEFAVGLIREWGLIGALVSHAWDVGGNNRADFSTTSVQYFYAFGIGNGQQIFASPTITFDWEADSDNDWTVPVGIGYEKTTKLGSRPFKFAVELNYYIEQPDSFGPVWLLIFSASPVVKNPFL